MIHPSISTERLVLTPYDMSDVDTWFDLVADTLDGIEAIGPEPETHRQRPHLGLCGVPTDVAELLLGLGEPGHVAG